MEDVARHPRLERRERTYYFRCRIPQDLLAHFKGKKFIRFSLKTTDPKEALARVKVETLKQDQEFDRIRHLSASEPVQELSATDIERLVLLREHRALESQERVQFTGAAKVGLVPWLFGAPNPSGGNSPEDLAKLKALNAEMLERWKGHLIRGEWAKARHAAKALLEEHGIKLRQDSPSFQKLCVRLLQSIVRTIEVQDKRLEGAIIEIPPAPPPPPAALNQKKRKPQDTDGTDKENPRLMELFRRWGDEKRRTGTSEKTIHDFGRSLARFVSLHGDLRIKEVTKAQVRDFKDAMLAFPRDLPPDDRDLPVRKILEKHQGAPALSLKTVNEKMLSGAKAIFSWAVDQGYRDDNPFMRVKVASAKGAIKQKVRLPFDTEDLNLIFKFPIYTSGDRPKAGAHEAAFWLPLLGLLTGARLGELGGLMVSDIKEKNGIAYIDIQPSELRPLKTASSVREVPLHPLLLEIGFLGYVRSLPQGGRLFPYLRSKQEQIAGPWGVWWSRYSSEHGVNDKRKVFHSFRHTFKDECRSSGIPKHIADILQGHASSSVGDSYGMGYDLPTKLREIAKLKYPGVDFSNIKWL